MNLMDQVRALISENHDKIEKTPLSIAMITSKISRRDYAFALAQLWQIHCALEQTLSSVDSLESYFTKEIVRTHTIERDLKALGYDLADFDVLPQTKLTATALRSWGLSSPCALLGALYVLEGSRMGSLVIARPLAKGLGLAEGSKEGIEYHVEGAATTPMRVKGLKEQLNQSMNLPESQRQVQFGASELMGLLLDVYQAVPIHNTNAASVHRPATDLPQVA